MEYEETLISVDIVNIKVIRLDYDTYNQKDILSKFRILLSDKDVVLCAKNTSIGYYDIKGNYTLDHLGNIEEVSKVLDSLEWLKKVI